MLESQFEAARITSDKTFHTGITNITAQHVQFVRDILFDPPKTGQYKHLKKELIRRLVDLDSMRLRKVPEGEQIGDRTTSQFYRDLRNLATPTIPDDFIFTLWLNRLPVHVQRVLTISEERKVETLNRMAERVHEIRPETGQIAVTPADSTAKCRTTKPRHGHGK
jgi:hypothetical protein